MNFSCEFGKTFVTEFFQGGIDLSFIFLITGIIVFIFLDWAVLALAVLLNGYCVLVIGGELWLGRSGFGGFGFVSNFSLSPCSLVFRFYMYSCIPVLPKVSTRSFQASGWIDNGFLILVSDMTFLMCLIFS